MAEYIEREPLLKRLDVSPLFSNIRDGGFFIKDGVLDIVQKQPTADVVEVRWKPIAGYERLYEVSTLGQVRNAKGLVMKQYLKRDKYTAYKKVALWKDGKYRHLYVHRLVAEAFIPNPDKLPIVNHKDEDGTNNLQNNLEWCDKSYNAKYGNAPKKISKAFRNKELTADHKAKISASMKLYRQKERGEKGYCDNGKHKDAKMDGKGDTR
jgi:hypothetical protein